MRTPLLSDYKPTGVYSAYCRQVLLDLRFERGANKIVE